MLDKFHRRLDQKKKQACMLLNCFLKISQISQTGVHVVEFAEMELAGKEVTWWDCLPIPSEVGEAFTQELGQFKRPPPKKKRKRNLHTCFFSKNFPFYNQAKILYTWISDYQSKHTNTLTFEAVCTRIQSEVRHKSSGFIASVDQLKFSKKKIKYIFYSWSLGVREIASQTLNLNTFHP